MTLRTYRPYNTTENEDLPAGLRLFQDSFNRILGDVGTRPWTPAVDIIESENDLVLKADVPGIELKDIDIQLENNSLTVKGERKFENEQKEQGYHRIERSYGTFARSFVLPTTVDTERVKAEYKNGVLTISIPKKEVAKPRVVKVEAVS